MDAWTPFSELPGGGDALIHPLHNLESAAGGRGSLEWPPRCPDPALIPLPRGQAVGVNLRREKQLLPARWAGLEGSACPTGRFGSFPRCPWAAEGVGHLQRTRPSTSLVHEDLYVSLSLPGLPVPVSSRLSLYRAVSWPMAAWCARCCLHPSNPLIGFLVPYTLNSRSLPSPLNLHVILPPCSAHRLLLFPCWFLPFPLSCAPGVLLSFLPFESATSSSFP